MNNKTVIFEGNIYEIDKYYLVSDSLCEDSWVPVRLYGFGKELRGFGKDANYPVNTSDGTYKHIKPLVAGTVKKVPVELINGNAYMFDVQNYVDWVGIFSATDNRFMCVGGGADFVGGGADLLICKNIRKMVVDDKGERK